VFGTALTSGGSVAAVENWLDRIRDVTPEQVAAAARAVLDGTHSVTAELLQKPQS
jgi:zinc protease